MRTRTLSALTLLTALLTLPGVVLADNYKLDETHMSFYFKVSHLGFSDTFGRFNKASGSFTVAGENSKFDIVIDAASVDTGLEKRDEHLRNPDFFNTKQFPKITFKSTAVSISGDTYTVTGDMTMHGVTKPVTFELAKHAEGEGPGGGYRTGFSTTAVIKRSDFGMTYGLPAVGDEVTLMISFEGIRQ